MLPRKRLRTGFIINVAGSIIPLFIALATVPLYVEQIGVARYGVISLVWVLLGYFGFLDLGLSRATANALSKIPVSAQNDRARVLVTSLALNFVMAVGGTLFMYLVCLFFLSGSTSIPADLLSEVNSALPWIACLLPLVLISSIGIGALESRENFLAANLLQVGGNIVGQLLPLACAYLISPSLAVVIPAAAIARALSAGGILFAVYWSEKPLRFHHFDRANAKNLLSYGGWVAISGIVSPFLNTLDQLVVGRILGVAAVTYYSVPMNLVVRSQLLAASLSRTLFPRLSNLPRDEANQVAARALIVSGIFYAVAYSIGILFVRLFLTLWMGADFAAHAGTLTILLLLGSWANALTFPPSSLVQGQGRPDLIAKLHIGQLLPYVALLVFLTKYYGLEGAAWAFVIRSFLDFPVLVGISSLGFRGLIPLVPSFALVIVTCFIEYFAGGQLVAISIYSALLCIASVVLLRQQDPQSYQQIMAILNNSRRRLRLARS